MNAPTALIHPSVDNAASTPADDIGTAPSMSHGAQGSQPQDLRTRRLGEPVLMISDTSASSFVFELRSRVNARVLVGGPISHNGDIEGTVAGLLDLCKRETSFRVDHRANGNVLKLCDTEGHEIGTSNTIAGEAMTRAMMKLIATQAGRARVVHCD